MSDFTGKIPFFRLLVPAIASILFHAAFPSVRIHWLLGIAGIALMLFSFFVRKEKRFTLRWIFGSGISVFVFYLAGVSYANHQKQTEFTFPETEATLLGVITDIPEIKPRSIALNVKTSYPLQKKVILYLQQTDEARLLQPGDEIVFAGTVQPFRNFGNPDDFDYERKTR